MVESSYLQELSQWVRMQRWKEVDEELGSRLSLVRLKLPFRAMNFFHSLSSSIAASISSPSSTFFDRVLTPAGERKNWGHWL